MIVSDVAWKQASNGKGFVKVVTSQGTYNAFEDSGAYKQVKDLGVKKGDEVKVEFEVNGKYKNLVGIEVLSSGNEVQAQANDSEAYWKEKHELDKKRFVVETSSKKWFLFSNSVAQAIEFYKVQASTLEAVISEDDVFKLAKKIYDEACGKALISGGEVNEKD